MSTSVQVFFNILSAMNTLSLFIYFPENGKCKDKIYYSLDKMALVFILENQFSDMRFM